MDSEIFCKRITGDSTTASRKMKPKNIIRIQEAIQSKLISIIIKFKYEFDSVREPPPPKKV